MLRNSITFEVFERVTYANKGDVENFLLKGEGIFNISMTRQYPSKDVVEDITLVTYDKFDIKNGNYVKVFENEYKVIGIQKSPKPSTGAKHLQTLFLDRLQ